MFGIFYVSINIQVVAIVARLQFAYILGKYSLSFRTVAISMSIYELL